MNQTTECDTKGHSVPATLEVRVWDNGEDMQSTQHIVCTECAHKIETQAEKDGFDYQTEKVY